MFWTLIGNRIPEEVPIFRESYCMLWFSWCPIFFNAILLLCSVVVTISYVVCFILCLHPVCMQITVMNTWQCESFQKSFSRENYKLISRVHSEWVEVIVSKVTEMWVSKIMHSIGFSNVVIHSPRKHRWSIKVCP